MNRELEDLKFIKRKNTECFKKLRELSKEIEEIITFVKSDSGKEWKKNYSLSQIGNSYLYGRNEIVESLTTMDTYLANRIDDINKENKNE